MNSPIRAWQNIRRERTAGSDWFHVTVNFLGVDGYQPLRVFHDMVQYQNQYTITYRPRRRIQPSDGIVVGKANPVRFFRYRNRIYRIGGRYASFDIDELVFLNRRLTNNEIRKLSQSSN